MKLSFLKKYFSSSKILTYLSPLVLIPLVASFCFLYTKYQRISDLEEKVLFIQNKMEHNKKTIQEEERILSQIKKGNLENFLEKVRTLGFLIPEQQKWKMCLAQLGPSLEIKEKYAFLETIDNKLEFAETSSQKTSLFIEKELSQQKPIRLNEEDLKNLLSSIEGISIGSYQPLEGSPQVIITSFSLEKSTFSVLQEKIYTVQMQLLTRQK